MPVIPRKINEALPRRDFLGLASKVCVGTSILLGVGALIHFLDYQSEPARPTEFDLGPAENYPMGAHTLVHEAEAIVLHAESGFIALSMVCPHLGCTLESTTEGFVCPCHSSRFDQQGTLLQGPATKSMTPLRVEQTSTGHLVLHTN